MSQLKARPELSYMPIRDSAGAFRWKNLLRWDFWRNMTVHFCICSLVGRWIETPWCIFCLHAFGIYDPDSLVWGCQFYPFCVYGVGAVVCIIVLTPLADWLLSRFKHAWQAGLAFYLICAVVTMGMEIGMGLLLNQPDAQGNYPLWDNSVLPFNVLDQAWLPNDIMLGLVAFLYTWTFYPLCERILTAMGNKRTNIYVACVLVIFIVLCLIHFV